MTIELDGEPYKVLHFSIMKQARGAAKTTIKFKNLKKGNTIENTYRSGEKFETAEILKQPSQYTYEDEVRICALSSVLFSLVSLYKCMGKYIHSHDVVLWRLKNQHDISFKCVEKCAYDMLIM